MSNLPKPHSPPVLCAYGSWWVPPYFVMAATQHGRKYEAWGQPNQDNYAVGQAGGAHWIIACDGLGGVDFGATGSHVVANTLNDYLGEKLSSGIFPTPELMVSAVRQARQALEALAMGRGVEVLNFATTIAVAVIKANSLTVATIGDSSVMAYIGVGSGADRKHKLVPVCSARLPDDVKRTASLGEPDWEEWLATTQINARDISAVLCFTDGAEGIFYTNEDPPTVDDEAVAALVEGWGNPEVKSRTFVNLLAQVLLLNPMEPNADDRTIVISMKAPANHVPPPLVPK